MADPTSNQPSGEYYDPPIPDIEGGDGGFNYPLDDGGGFSDPLDDGSGAFAVSDEGVYNDPLPDTPGLYPSVSQEEESQALDAIYNPTLKGLTERIRSPMFNAMTTIEQDSLLEAYAEEMVKQGLYNEEEMLYVSKELQEELGVRGVVWDPGATSFGPGSEPLSPLSQTTDRPVTLEEFMSDVGLSIDADTPPWRLDSRRRQRAVLREKLRHIAKRDDVFSPSGLGPGLEEGAATLGGLLGQWFEDEETATLTEDPILFGVKTVKQLGQFYTWKFAIAAGTAASFAQDVYNNINNLPTVPGELQDIDSRLTLSGLDAIGATESLKRLGLGTDIGVDYGLGPTARRDQELQIMGSYLKGSGIVPPGIQEAASLFHHINRITARTGASAAVLLEMLPKWLELSEMRDPDTGQLLKRYSVMDLAQDHIRSMWKNSFELAAEGAPEARPGVESGISFARNMLNSFNRDVGFSEEERRLRAQMAEKGRGPHQPPRAGGLGMVPPEVWGEAPRGMDSVAPFVHDSTFGPRFADKKNAQQQASDYWRRSTPDDAARVDRYVRSALVRRDTDAVYKAAQNGLFGGPGRRAPEFFEAMYTAQLINGEPIKRGMMSLYGLQQLYFFGRQMPYNITAALTSMPLILTDMSPADVDSYADNLTSMLPMDMTKDEAVEMLHYGKERHIKEPVFSWFDMYVGGAAGGLGLKLGTGVTQAGKVLRDPIPGLESGIKEALGEPLREPVPDMPPHALPPIERRAQTVREAIAEAKRTELEIAELQELRGEPLTKMEKAAIKYGTTSAQSFAGLGALFTRMKHDVGNRQGALTRYIERPRRVEKKPSIDPVWESRPLHEGEVEVIVDPASILREYGREGGDVALQLKGERAVDRVSKINDHVQGGGKLHPSQYSSEPGSGPGFTDGRHRMLWAVQQGMRNVPVITTKSSLKALNKHIRRPRRDPLSDVYTERNQLPGAATTIGDPFAIGDHRLSTPIRVAMAKSTAEAPRSPLSIEVGPWEEARRRAKRPTEKGREDLERAKADGRKLINPDTGREFMPPPSSKAGEGPAPLRPEVVVEGPSISRDKAREAAAEGDPAALAVVEAAREVARGDAAATEPIATSPDMFSRAKEFMVNALTEFFDAGIQGRPEGRISQNESLANAATRFMARFYPSAPEAWRAKFIEAAGDVASYTNWVRREKGEVRAVEEAVAAGREEAILRDYDGSTFEVPLSDYTRGWTAGDPVGGARKGLEWWRSRLLEKETSLKKVIDDMATAPRGPIEPPGSLGVGPVERAAPGAEPPKPPKPDKMTRDMLGTEVKTDAEGRSRVDVVEGGVGGVAEELGLFNKDGSIDLTNYVSTTPFLQRVLNMAARGQGGRHLYEWFNNQHKKNPQGPGEALTEAQLTTAAGLSMERRAAIRQSKIAADAPSLSIFPGKAERSVRHARDLYNEAVAEIAMREGVSPSEWLLVNKVQEIAQSFIEMGISDPSIYQQISKGGHTISPKHASGLAVAGARMAERPAVIPKDKFNGADALRLPGRGVSGDWMPREGERPYRALGTEATMTPESRFADMARSGELVRRGDVELPIEGRYQFGTDQRPAWARIASTFLDARGIEIIRGAEDVKVLGHSLNPVQRGVYAVSEFMMRPFAFVNTLWHVADFMGNRLRNAGSGGPGPTPNGLVEGFLWGMTGPNRKFGDPLANELLRATRTADSYADLVKGVVKVFDKKKIKLNEKEIVRMLRDLDMADAIEAVRGDFSSRGKQVLDGVQVQRWLDIAKRFEDTPITDPTGRTYTVSEFMEPYALYEGKWVKLEELNQRLLFNEIVPEKFRLGTRDFSYRPKGDVAWGDLTSQQRSIMLIANQLSRPLDRVFFDMSTQLVMSEHAMRLSLGKNDAFVVGNQLLSLDKGSLVKRTTNWMADFYDSRANLTFVVDVYNSMIKAGATPAEIDGRFGALKLVDKQLGMIAPGGGKRSRDTIGTKEFKEVFTREVLRERLDAEGIRYDKRASREKLIDLQPDLRLSEIYNLLWKSSNKVATAYFTKHFANGREPTGLVERYYKSKVWDTQFNYQQKLDHGLWDIREAAVKAASELGAALAKQRLTIWMRQNGLILTHNEHLNLVDQAVYDAKSRGASGKEVEKARQRAERLKENMFRSQKSGYWELPSGNEGTFMVHKYADKYMQDHAKMMDAGTKAWAKMHQFIKLGYVARSGTIIRNALSNYWIFGKMAAIPWIARGAWHTKAMADLEASISGGKVSQEYLALMREGGAQGGGYQRSEMTPSESLARVHLELLKDFERAEKHKGAEEIVSAIFGVIQEPPGGRKKGEPGSKTHEIFERMGLSDMRSPTGEWVDSAGPKRQPPLERIKMGAQRGKDWVAQKYGLVDEGAKLSYAYQLMMEHGYTAKQAHKTVNETFMAWDNVAPFINTIRNKAWGVALSGPFISFIIMATEKAHGMLAKNPRQSMVWANLLQTALSTSSAAVGIDRDDLAREMLLSGTIPLPMLASQPGKYLSWGDESGVAGTGVTGKALARAEAGALGLEGGLVNPITPYELNRQSVRPSSTFGKVMAVTSVVGGSPLVQALQAYADPLMDPLPLGGTSSHERAGQEMWQRFVQGVGPVMPGAVRDLLGVASMIQDGQEVFGVSRSLIEGISGPLGWSTKIISPVKKAQFVAARLTAVARDVEKRLSAANDEYGEYLAGGLSAPIELEEEIKLLTAISTELPHLMQQVTVAKDRAMLDNYHLWFPRLLAMYSDDPFSSVMGEIEEAIGGAKPGTDRYKSVISKLDTRTKHEWERYVVRRDQSALYQIAIERKEADYPAPPPPNPLWQ